MALLNKASKDQIISPDTVITTTEMQNDVVVQPPAVNAIQLLHSIKPNILSIIFNQFLTIREMLTLRNTCQQLKILLFQNDNADVVMFCKHSGWNELDNMPLIWSNLDRSSKIGHLPIVQYLIMKNAAVANVNQRNNDGESPLLVSSRKGHLRVVKYLVDHRADVNQLNNDGESPLLVSSRMDHLSIVQNLVDHEADVNQTNNNGESPLLVSSRSGNLTIVRYLVDHGADVNQTNNNGESPVLVSSRSGNLTIVRYLVDHRANVNQTNNNGGTPLLVSSRMGHLSVVQYLVDHGARHRGLHAAVKIFQTY